jgi:Spy/CpxP family protein refolding chaperone
VNGSNRGKALLYAGALVLFGMIIGAMFMSRVDAKSQTLRLGRSEEIADRIRERLIEKLDLTPEQKTRIEPLIRKTAQEMENAHLDCLKQVSKSLDALHTQIKPELIPEQQHKLVELDSERDSRMVEKYNYRAPATNASAH